MNNKAKKLYPFKFSPDSLALDETSEIANGFLAENSIDDIIDTYLEDFLGNNIFQYFGGIFPVRISVNKLEGSLPLQAHPDNNTASERYMTWGKAKMWYITEAKATDKIYLGFNRQMNATDFYNACIDGSIEKELYSFTPKAGDCIYIQPGCVYSASGSFSYIEVAQNSEVTYHLNNEMEIAEAIDVVDYNKIDPSGFVFNNVKGNITIVNSSNFIVKSVELKENGSHSAQSYAANSFKVYICMNGEALISADNNEYNVAAGEMCVVPCAIEEFEITAANGGYAHLLEVSMPELAEEEDDLYLNYNEDESNYPTGSGTDPEEDECDCDDEDCHCGHHHHEHCDCEDEHHHCGCDCEDEHIGQRFFKK